MSFFSPSENIYVPHRYVKLKIYGHKLPNIFYKFHSYSKIPKGKYIFLTERQTIPLTSDYSVTYNVSP